MTTHTYMVNFTERFRREGKTAKDHKSGYTKRRDANRALRDDYVQHPNAAPLRMEAVCSGKGNSSVPFKIGTSRHRSKLESLKMDQRTTRNLMGRN